MNRYEKLTLLGVFHYVLAALTALFGCVPLYYVVLGLMILSGRAWSGGNRVPPETGMTFVGVGVLASVMAWALAAALAACGYHLRTQRHRAFCLVVAAIECLSLPFGTILGVVTLVALCDPQVKETFDRRPPGPSDKSPTPFPPSNS